MRCIQHLRAIRWSVCVLSSRYEGSPACEGVGWPAAVARVSGKRVSAAPLSAPLAVLVLRMRKSTVVGLRSWETLVAAGILTTAPLRTPSLVRRHTLESCDSALGFPGSALLVVLRGGEGRPAGC